MSDEFLGRSFESNADTTAKERLAHTPAPYQNKRAADLYWHALNYRCAACSG